MNVIIKTSRSRYDYNKQTDCRSMPYNGIFINPERLSKGNSKLYKILIFDLPAIKSCLNCSSCAKRCYAIQAEVQYPETEIYRTTNFHLAMFNPIFLSAMIINQLSHTRIKTVRIHSSGDFFSQSYLDLWDAIISVFPHINFYAYTKVDSILDFSVIKKNKNFNLISSFVEGKLNFGSIDYCIELNKEHGTFICPATLNEDVRCGLQCSHCVTDQNVCFVEH